MENDHAEKAADVLVAHIDKLVRAHAMGDDRAAEDERIKLWHVLKSLIVDLSRVSTCPRSGKSPPDTDG